MKFFRLLLLLLLLSNLSYARHIAGGELYYNYVSPDATRANNSIYVITLRLFRECNSGGPTLEAEQATGQGLLLCWYSLNVQPGTPDDCKYVVEVNN